MNIEVSLVVIHYGDIGLTESLLDSLRAHPDEKLISEVIIVDNGEDLSTSDVQVLRELGAQKIVYNQDSSYSSGVNAGVEVAESEYLIISNNDVEWINGESIKPLLSTAINENAGVVGPQQVYPNGSWERSSGVLPTVSNSVKSILFVDAFTNAVAQLLFKLGNRGVSEVDYVDGAFMLIDSECFTEVGGFDESFDFYAEEADFCVRARKHGWEILRDSRARIVHIRGASSSSVASDEYSRKLEHAKLRLVEKHRGRTHRRIYRYLRTISLIERSIVYSIVGRLAGPYWSERGENARSRLRAFWDTEGHSNRGQQK